MKRKLQQGMGDSGYGFNQETHWCTHSFCTTRRRGGRCHRGSLAIATHVPPVACGLRQHTVLAGYFAACTCGLLITAVPLLTCPVISAV
jgi:hypothetical protein